MLRRFFFNHAAISLTVNQLTALLLIISSFSVKRDDGSPAIY
jgi:hypothetical protein